jgi:hypothetical protein
MWTTAIVERDVVVEVGACRQAEKATDWLEH